MTKRSLAKFGAFMFFWCIWILSLCGVYHYFRWLLSVDLLTTGGVVGVILALPVLIAEVLFTAFCFFGIYEVLK